MLTKSTKTKLECIGYFAQVVIHTCLMRWFLKTVFILYIIQATLKLKQASTVDIYFLFRKFLSFHNFLKESPNFRLYWHLTWLMPTQGNPKNETYSNKNKYLALINSSHSGHRKVTTHRLQNSRRQSSANTAQLIRNIQKNIFNTSTKTTL